KHVGQLQIPRSSNESGWSSLYVPVVCIKNGSGPTALVLGGNHGDEPEGHIAALKLARDTRPEDVRGRLIVIPCLSPEASRAFTRLWPSGANFNRAFPGSPDGSPDQQLADYLTRALIPLSDLVCDIHSGGRSMLALPWSEMHLVDDPTQRRRMVEAMLAWNTDYHSSTSTSPGAACWSARPSARERSPSAPSWAVEATAPPRFTGSPTPAWRICS